MRIYSRILATSLSALVATTQINGVAWAARPACFVFASNSVPTPIFSASAGSLSAAEASTSQVLEVLAERRSEASPCPPGLSRINGICIAQQVASVTPVFAPPPQPAPAPVAAPPPAPIVAATPAAPTVLPSPAPKAASTLAAPAVSAAKTAAAAPTQKPIPPASATALPPKMSPKATPIAAAPSKDPAYAPTFAYEHVAPQPERKTGAWTEAFADRERRASSHTSTAGIVVGYDRQFNWDSARVRLGGIVSYANITASEVAPTSVTLSLKEAVVPRDITATLTFDGVTSTASKTRTNGVGGGVTWSLARGNSFWDGVAKVDIFELSSSSSMRGLIAQDPNNPDVRIYDGLGPNSDLRIYKADGTSTEFSDVASYRSAAAGCIIAGTDQTDPATKIKDKIDQLFSASSTSKSGTASLAVMTLANTFGFTRDLGNGLTLEPSVGFRYSYSHYYNDDASLGLRDGHVLRLEAGGKLSHLQPIGRGAMWSNTIGLYVYSDVFVDGFIVSTDGSSFKGDQGEVRLRGMLQSKIRFNDGLQIYAEVNGRVGHDYQALGGKLGLRLEW